jgi:uncharacterized damage-inducible protein DinB
MLNREYAELMAQYNLVMNEKLYVLCSDLTDEQRKQDRGAFFKTIHGTLSHLVWADRAFLIRLLCEPGPIGRPEDFDYPDFAALRAERQRLDQVLCDWARNLREGSLAEPYVLKSVVYKTQRRMPLYVMVVQMFNHQTHHRGQLTTLLSQMGIDPGVTDIPFLLSAKGLISEASEAED